MIKRLVNWLTQKTPEAEARLRPLPIAINAPIEVALQRALGRLLNLYSVPNPSQEILIEIERYKLAVASYGHPAPINFEETERLIAQTRE